MYDTMQLCVGCKGCKRECPTGVDMARMKTEFLYHYRKRHGLRLHDKLIAYLPHYAPYASRFRALLNLRDRLPGLPWLSEKAAGFSARRPLPRWHGTPFRPVESVTGDAGGREVVLLADTFNTWFEPDNLRAAVKILQGGGYRVHLPQPAKGGRPLCCGRTFLAAGLVDQARVEAQRMLKALRPFIEQGLPVIGLEPSCLLTLRDEFKVLSAGPETDTLAQQALMFEEFLAAEHDAGRLKLSLKEIGQSQALLHGHCHQKAFDVMGPVQTVLGLIPGLTTTMIESGCCGMAGAFGYGTDTYEVSRSMGELNLLPAVRAATADTVIVADGTSCRHQIADGSGRPALHVAQVLARALTT
jgi:Fe-S oxidoreductase